MSEVMSPEPQREPTTHLVDHRSDLLFRDGSRQRLHQVTPENATGPLQKVAFLPGWNNPFPPQSMIDGIVGDNRAVYYVEGFEHGYAHPKDIFSKEVIDRYPSSMVRQAAGFKRLIDHIGGDDLEVVAHSQGGVAAMIAAASDQFKKVKWIVLVEPAGMMGEDTGSGVVARYAQETILPGIGEKRDIQRRIKTLPRGVKVFSKKEVYNALENKARNGNEALAAGEPVLIPPGSVRSTVTHPVLSAKEVWGMAHANLQEDMQALIDRGVQIVVMAGTHDLAFPSDKIGNNLKTDPTGFDSKLPVTGFVSVAMDHGFGGRGKVVGEAIGGLFDTMKAKGSA